MKRRNFLQSIGAAALVPALPLQSLAASAPASLAASLEQPYLWASFVSRVHNKSSPAMLTRLLKLDPATATKIHAKLMADNVITAPNAMGLSRAVNPYPQFTLGNSAVAQTVAPTTQAPSTTTKSSLSKVQQASSEDVTPTDTELASQPEHPQSVVDSQSVNRDVTALANESESTKPVSSSAFDRAAEHG